MINPLDCDEYLSGSSELKCKHFVLQESGATTWRQEVYEKPLVRALTYSAGTAKTGEKWHGPSRQKL